MSKAKKTARQRKSRSIAKSRRPPLPERVRAENFTIRYKNGKITEGENIQKFETVTKDKIKIQRLKALLSDPLVGRALDRSALFYVSRSDLRKSDQYLDLKKEIETELKAK